MPHKGLYLPCIITCGYAVCTSNRNERSSIPISSISFVPHFSRCWELKSNAGMVFCFLTWVVSHFHTHLQSAGNLKHFTMFLVSNENVITGNAHFRPSKTLHCFMSPLLTLCNHLTVFKHPPEKFFHYIWYFFPQYQIVVKNAWNVRLNIAEILETLDFGERSSIFFVPRFLISILWYTGD